MPFTRYIPPHKGRTVTRDKVIESPRGKGTYPKRRAGKPPVDYTDPENPYKSPVLVPAKSLPQKVTAATLTWDRINGSGPPSRRGFVQLQRTRGHDWVFAHY